MTTRHYGTGYGQEARGNANLPTHIKCKVCSRVKGPDSYSGKQLDILLKKLRETKGFDASKMPLITCTMETSKQVVELECFVCDRWMGLDKFTKAQRKTPDQAECMVCVAERLAMEPHEVGRDADDDFDRGSDEGGSRGSDDDSDDDYLIDKTTGRMSNMSMTNGPSTYPSHYGGSSTGGHGGVTLAAESTTPTSRQTGTSVAGSASTARSKFDPKKYGGSVKSSSGGGAWAKVPAGPRKPTAKVDSSDEDDNQIIDDSD